ncbi:hypothetical protein [Streptomyces sp. MNU76]|nr:hypothetical protein [Streptomyces sp. MNU76]
MSGLCSDQPIPLTYACGPLLAATRLDKDELLPPDTTVWLHRD